MPAPTWYIISLRNSLFATCNLQHTSRRTETRPSVARSQQCREGPLHAPPKCRDNSSGWTMMYQVLVYSYQTMTLASGRSTDASFLFIFTIQFYRKTTCCTLFSVGWFVRFLAPPVGGWMCFACEKHPGSNLKRCRTWLPVPPIVPVMFLVWGCLLQQL